MSTSTSHYNLTKPANGENYSLDVWNGNMDKIDAGIWAGLRYRGTLSSSNDLNNITTDGLYYIQSTAPSNSPSGQTVIWSIFLQFSPSSTMVHQFIFRPAGGKFFMRERSGPQSAWLDWMMFTGTTV